MLKLIQCARHFSVSSSLRALMQFKLDRQNMSKDQQTTMMSKLTLNVDQSDSALFLLEFKDLNYNFAHVANLYNQGLNAESLLIALYRKFEISQGMDRYYNNYLKLGQSTSETAISDFLENLTEQGKQTIQSLQPHATIQQSISKCLQQASFQRWFSTTPQLNINKHQQLKSAEMEILAEIDVSALIYKISVMAQHSPPTEEILTHFSNQISKKPFLSSRDLVVLSGLVSRLLDTVGNISVTRRISNQLDRLLTKQTTLNLADYVALAKIFNKNFYLSAFRTTFSPILNAQYKSIPLPSYPVIFKVLANYYWDQISLLEHEEYIQSNLERLVDLSDEILPILEGLLYSDSKNTELTERLLLRLIAQESQAKLPILTKCRVYQSLRCFEFIHGKELNFPERTQLQQVYFNRTELRNLPAFSLNEHYLYENLKNLQAKLEKDSRPSWKICKISRRQQIDIFQIDFVLELEGIYRKKIVYLDIVPGSQSEDFNISKSGRKLLKYKILLRESVKLIYMNDWNEATDKEVYLKSLLGF